MGTIGHASAGGVGQEELQTANQVPGDAHFDGVRPAEYRNCGDRGCCQNRESGTGRRGRRLLGETTSPSCTLSFLFYPQEKSVRLKTNW